MAIKTISAGQKKEEFGCKDSAGPMVSIGRHAVNLMLSVLNATGRIFGHGCIAESMLPLNFIRCRGNTIALQEVSKSEWPLACCHQFHVSSLAWVHPSRQGCIATLIARLNMWVMTKNTP